ncbi:MAG: hypothetical protein JSV25_06860 [Spirochaetota bacterium]|nr:MAG: hypothetical protein JSV25_06860 [Spirochaetota bacterium]
MRKCLFVSIVIILIVSFPAIKLSAQQRRELPDIHGKLETAVGLKYITSEDLYSFSFPLYGWLQLTHETGILHAVVSLDYINEPGLGETYVKGGSDYSYLKIGNYTEDWGVGYALSSISILNSIDDRYPQNIFYQRFHRPNPMFTMTVGNEELHEQFVISARDEGIPTIYNTYLGFRMAGRWAEYDMSIGFIRRTGLPPPLFFITAKREGAASSLWTELGWEYVGNVADLGGLIFGYWQKLYQTELTFEYTIWGANSYFFVENSLLLNDFLGVGVKGFVHFSDVRDAWSSALNLFLSMGIEKGLDLEPGVYLFFGKPYTPLSPHKRGNDNELYLRFTYQF